MRRRSARWNIRIRKLENDRHAGFGSVAGEMCRNKSPAMHSAERRGEKWFLAAHHSNIGNGSGSRDQRVEQNFASGQRLLRIRRGNQRIRYRQRRVVCFIYFASRGGAGVIRRSPIGRVPANMVGLQQRNCVVHRNHCAGRGRDRRGGGQRKRRAACGLPGRGLFRRRRHSAYFRAQPLSFHETHHFVRIQRKHRRAALPWLNFVRE